MWFLECCHKHLNFTQNIKTHQNSIGSLKKKNMALFEEKASNNETDDYLPLTENK